MTTSEDDDKFAETFSDVFDGLRLAGAGKSDQRGAGEVGGSPSKGNVAPIRIRYTSNHRNVDRLILLCCEMEYDHYRYAVMT